MECMSPIILAAERAVDEYVDATQIARLDLANGRLAVEVGADCTANEADITDLTGQTVFELERLSEALIYVAGGKLEHPKAIRSRDMLVGPLVHLRPSVTCLVGLTAFYITPIHLPGRARRQEAGHADIVLLTAQFRHRGARGGLELSDAVRLGQAIYEEAHSLDQTLQRDRIKGRT
jgi:hypothetical protein